MSNVPLNYDKNATVHTLVQTYILYGSYTGALKSLNQSLFWLNIKLKKSK